jgi:hypothetical protein
VYYLNKRGAEMIGGQVTVTGNSPLQHIVMRNDIYFFIIIRLTGKRKQKRAGYSMGKSMPLFPMHGLRITIKCILLKWTLNKRWRKIYQRSNGMRHCFNLWKKKIKGKPCYCGTPFLKRRQSSLKHGARNMEYHAR